MAFSTVANVLQIEAQHMPHEAYIRRCGEDWAGVTDQKERKRLQNRLNKRASRQRETQHHDQARTVDVPRRSVVVYSNDDVMFRDVTEENIKQKRAILRRFAEQYLASYAACQPSADHLLRLIQLNVIDSLTRNSVILGFRIDWLVCSAISPFSYAGPHLSLDAHMAPCPDNLVPTKLQLRIPHHPWIDLFPVPRMRGNFLVAVSGILSEEEEQQLWDDIIESRGEGDWSGLVVWGELWDPRNWEVTMPFLQRWGWLLEGCHEILEATNYWRRQRGEKRLDLASLQPKGQIQLYTTRHEQMLPL
ncbi:hypothetical protein F5X99DRAFT_391906 [Biscogniauxia marginata]|nr:hypothetical protein F5X99DRAFT_391906 [Biscogniauxia marginata]